MIYSVSGFCKVGLKVYSMMRFHTEQKILVFTNITNQMYIQIGNLFQGSPKFIASLKGRTLYVISFGRDKTNI